MSQIIFFDIETDYKGKKVFDIGAVSNNNREFRSADQAAFSAFLQNTEYLCGHNIFEHDLPHMKITILQSNVKRFIDTLHLSPLLFPCKPYHKIGKQYKIVSEEEQNNPLLDAKLAHDLFHDEIAAFNELDERVKSVLYALLYDKREFCDFFHFIDYSSSADCTTNISEYFRDKICANADFAKYIVSAPIELAYSLALINADDKYSITPPWVLRNYPLVENVVYNLRSKRCIEGCAYCNENIEPTKALLRLFGYPSFRTYEGEPLQERAATAAIDGKSLLAIFPTGGGKSITFQLPALVQGEAVRGLTVVISPLQSLMKDQVDNLEQKGITDAVTINGALDPIERAKSHERVEDGTASILYISPESLRSRSIETLLLKRNVVRFVIDEAHCFSSWGQDFRVDYLYIGDFIRKYQEKKNLSEPIPVSCFTATAKQRVIEDICDYFKEKLSLELELFRSGAQRTNLSYSVFNKTTPEDKYQQLRTLLEIHDCPAIVYVSRTRRTKELADRLNDDGVIGSAVCYHGRMDRQERIENQEKFMNGGVRIIVATAAFGMGVDKANVGAVIHFDISTSLEDYVQEAGRAGRDENINANCYVLYDEEDLNKHFALLNQTKLSIKEIQQIWRATKEITRLRSSASKSALEIARVAGWDDGVADIETRVRTAVAALEDAGFMQRGQNMPRIFANAVLVKNMAEAVEKINTSHRFVSDKEREHATRIISNLLGAKSRASAGTEGAEARVDYLSDMLGIVKEDIIRVINIMREERILADAKDLIAFIRRNRRVNVSLDILSEYAQIEKVIINQLPEIESRINFKDINKFCEESVPSVSIQKIKTIFNFYAIKNWIKRGQGETKDIISVKPNFTQSDLLEKHAKRLELAQFIIKYLFEKSLQSANEKEEIDVEFSCLELKEHYETNLLGNKTSFEEIDDALYYLSKISALRLDGAFLVAYNAMRIERIEQDTRRQYKKEDYKRLEEFYGNKVQQIHIVGEYAKRMTNDYQETLHFVDDYFNLNYDAFLRKYFKGREGEIHQNITPKKFKQLFGDLSPRQLSIIKDVQSKYIVVAAGPGSGKTKVLVHKLASLYMMEDVKHEQMLMLTFSRAAATEFKKRLLSPTMLGNAANFIQINTFHAYCFDLLGRVGTLSDADSVISEAIRRIKSREIEINKITKTVLVIDEAQDMSACEFSLVQALMELNENMRVIAVGDDDQNIYEFRGSDSKYLRQLIGDYDATKYELLDNYRSRKNIVALANVFATKLSERLKETPIHAIQNIDGNIVITKHKSKNLAVPLVADILDKPLAGSICVLTETNDEAATVAGLLVKSGFSARLIQDNAGFNIYNLAEIRYFVDELNLRDDVYNISDETWQTAKRKTAQEFSSSAAYDYVKNLIQDFEQTNPHRKYKSDFLQFIHESKLEDFCEIQSLQIFVSTIHKAKGREFDNVFLMLKNNPTTDELHRAVYVAITRAKNNLYIHTLTSCFDGMNVDGVDKRLDDSVYQEPTEIVVPVSYKGVALDEFRFFKDDIAVLKSGDALSIKCESVDYKDGRAAQKWFLHNGVGNRVTQFSKAMDARIDEMLAKGYAPQSAKVRLVVWWKKQGEDGKEHPEVKIILPDIHLVKKVYEY